VVPQPTPPRARQRRTASPSRSVTLANLRGAHGLGLPGLGLREPGRDKRFKWTADACHSESDELEQPRNICQCRWDTGGGGGRGEDSGGVGAIQGRFPPLAANLAKARAPSLPVSDSLSRSACARTTGRTRTHDAKLEPGCDYLKTAMMGLRAERPWQPRVATVHERCHRDENQQ
jgi:hypothetical protein